jgi:hypothetical protein
MRTGLRLRTADVGMQVGNTPGPLEQKNRKMGQESDESLGEWHLSMSRPDFRKLFTHGTPTFNNGSWSHITKFRLRERRYKICKPLSYIDEN